LTLKMPNSSTIELRIQPEGAENYDHQPKVQVIRVGTLMVGTGIADPTLGWFSPTYNTKEPALTLAYQITAPLPLTLMSIWNLA